MTDIALAWDNALWRGDIGVAGGDLAADDGLRTAVYLSLFTDAPAHDDDPLPASGYRGGWWGDALAETPGDAMGSRLWLLRREKQLSSVLVRAQDYAAEALQWLIDDKIAAAVTVTATNPARGILRLAVSIVRPDSRQLTYDYDLLWNATA